MLEQLGDLAGICWSPRRLIAGAVLALQEAGDGKQSPQLAAAG